MYEYLITLNGCASSSLKELEMKKRNSNSKYGYSMYFSKESQIIGKIYLFTFPISFFRH